MEGKMVNKFEMMAEKLSVEFGLMPVDAYSKLSEAVDMPAELYPSIRDGLVKLAEIGVDGVSAEEFDWVIDKLGKTVDDFNYQPLSVKLAVKRGMDALKGWMEFELWRRSFNE